MNIADFPDDSETSDEDYTPEKSNNELPSEEESDGDCEDALPNVEELGNRGSKRRKRASKSKKKSKNETPKENKQEDKGKTDDLWASFKQDTGFKTRAERQQQSLNKETNSDKPKHNEHAKDENSSKVTVTQIFKFAGEEVKVEKEVSKNSNEYKVLNNASGSRPRTGITSVLNQLGKKTKINTLEKSKMDWDRFKKEEKIEDELVAYGKSKDGYLEKQDFLQRADLRRFEIEKEIRSSLKTNKMNNLNI